MHLARGGYLGILVDQKMNDGVEARLFGRPAMTAPALAAFALRLKCPVIPGYVMRTGPARFHLVAEEPLVLPDTGDREADILTLTQMVNDRLEAWVRARPESWLWLHRRFREGAVSDGWAPCRDGACAEMADGAERYVLGCCRARWCSRACCWRSGWWRWTAAGRCRNG